MEHRSRLWADERAARAALGRLADSPDAELASAAQEALDTLE
jgi:hypothetical protein